ncbi:MAG TPA: rhodanese-like domain-containing protein [Candidatus Sulfotelmatobacter sp.]|jgi:rhodanese-related sulfurtransferase|nr:rhodanese-like domain-containing protein [Candidatus Sulfotelmatobacter sp.]
MERWWPDGTERGGVLWKGITTIVLTGCVLGVLQNALVRRGDPKSGLAWRYEPPSIDSLESVAVAAQASGKPSASPAPAAPAASAAPAAAPDMNDPLGLGAASADNFDVPDVPRPLQIQMVRVKQFFDAKAATIVDAREATDYAEGHIPGAINLPYDQVVTDPARLDAFDPKGKPIIVYCGGGTCELSMNLGFALVSAGKKKVLVFMGGWPEWSASGYPIAKGPTPDGA